MATHSSRLPSAGSIKLLSKAGQMRAKRAEGMSVGDIARLFDVTYHNAYSATVMRKAATARPAFATPNSSTPFDPSVLSNNELLEAADELSGATTPAGKQRRIAVHKEMDDRWPTDEEQEKAERAWKKAKV